MECKWGGGGVARLARLPLLTRALDIDCAKPNPENDDSIGRDRESAPHQVRPNTYRQGPWGAAGVWVGRMARLSTPFAHPIYIENKTNLGVA